MGIVPLRFRIEQVEGRDAYKGYFILGDVTFDFDFDFHNTIPPTDGGGGSHGATYGLPTEVSLKRGGAIVELEESEKTLFTQLLLDLLLSLHQAPGARRIIGLDASSSKALASARMTTAVTSRCDTRLTKKQCDILTKPKFGCVFE